MRLPGQRSNPQPSGQQPSLFDYLPERLPYALFSRALLGQRRNSAHLPEQSRKRIRFFFSGSPWTGSAAATFLQWQRAGDMLFFVCVRFFFPSRRLLMNSWSRSSVLGLTVFFNSLLSRWLDMHFSSSLTMLSMASALTSRKII